jgi:hypothetical protein
VKRTFTILHTNDLHSAFVGLGPAADYTPFTLSDDDTIGGYARQATLIAQRRQVRSVQGPVLVLCGGDYSMGTPFGAATRETGCELQLMSMMGYDGTTFGNHEFDLGPAGLSMSIGVAARSGRIPAVIASNTRFEGSDPSLAEIQRLKREGVISEYKVIDRGGIRFGIFGVMGKEAISVAVGSGAVKFTDFIETAREMVKLLRSKENADVIIALSHGGVMKGNDGSLYSLTCPLMLVPLIVALPKLTGGKLSVVPKNKDGQPLKSSVEALVNPSGSNTAQLMLPSGTTDRESLATETSNGAVREIKEWQAIMDHLRTLPVMSGDELPVIPVDERAAEVRAIMID